MVIDPATQRPPPEPYVQLSAWAMAVKRAIHELRRKGYPMLIDMRIHWRHAICVARQHKWLQSHARLRHLLRQCPRAFWKTYLKKACPPPCILSATESRQYYIVAVQQSSQTSLILHHPSSALTSPMSKSKVIHAFKKFGTKKAARVDAMPAESITRACTQHQHVTTFHFPLSTFHFPLSTFHFPLADICLPSFYAPTPCPPRGRSNAFTPFTRKGTSTKQ
jgi:hypothetical protein